MGRSGKSDYLKKKRVLRVGFILFPGIAGYLDFIFKRALKFQLDKVEGCR
jgi:hypothetical protein